MLMVWGHAAAAQPGICDVLTCYVTLLQQSFSISFHLCLETLDFSFLVTRAMASLIEHTYGSVQPIYSNVQNKKYLLQLTDI